MNLRTGFTSLDAPEEELPELLEDNRMFAKNVFASVASALDFQANTNPSPSGFTMATAKFPGQNCAACGGEFVPGITEIEVDPDRVGPKGGKKYVHSNPNECMAHSNPYAATNAGNRMKWDADAAGGARSVPKPGRPAPLPRPRGPQAGKDLAYVHAQDLLGMSARDLAQMTTSSLEGVASAVAGELERRGRTKSGRKTAWGEGPAPKFANVKARA
jgi:hypothetical protein